MKNIHIPNFKKKINFKEFDINKIIKFEKLIFEKFNKGIIRFPIHLTKGNENFLKEIFQYISPKDLKIALSFLNICITLPRSSEIIFRGVILIS